MCPPDFFRVQYVINPWMKNKIGTIDQPLARKQWTDFYQSLKGFTSVELITQESDAPDMVFTANAGLLLGNKIVLSRFKFAERRSEESYFYSWFEKRGYEVIQMPESVHFEGKGDALLQPGKNLLWASYGYRSDLESHNFLAGDFDIEIVSLHLIDPSFYHLDTCFCPLLNDQIMYFPGGFDSPSLKRIEDKTLPENRLAISPEDAHQFACNAVLVGSNLFMNKVSDPLRKQLENWGYKIHIHPVSEFMKAGGANKCLTLALGNPP
jgi:N-dimethylarginine dimethylaminohydrolase